MTTASDLIHKYTDPVTGAIDVARALGEGAATQVGSGLAGIGSAVGHLSMDAGADAVDKFQREHQPGELSPAGIKAIQGIAPSFYKAAHSGVAQDAQALMDKYNSGVDTVAHGVGSILPQAGAAISATGAALPNAAIPEMGEEGAVEHALEPAISKYASAAANDSPVAHTISLEGAGDGYQPSAVSMVARHPETGQELGRLTMQPRGGVMQGIRSDVSPEAQGQGIGTKLLQRAIDRSHERGMDFQSDTSVTPSQMATYLKLREKGYPVEVNPNAEHWDSPDGPALRSTDGSGVVSVNRPVDAEHATPQDLPKAMVVPHTNGYGTMVNGQILSTHPDLAGAQDAVDAVNAGNFKEGGEVGTLAGGLSDLMHQYAPLKGMPVKATIPGAGVLDVAPNPTARAAAAAYAKESGIPNTAPSTYARVDPAKGQAIARAFDAMPHNPDDPATKASYQALMDETKAQYQHMKSAGVNVEFMPPGKDPYAQSPRLMAEDVAQNNHMYVYPTSSGFGGDEALSGNPLLGDSGESFGGVPATHNDLFRAVHDYFGHAKEGVGFRANGEENAWRQHAGMYSDAARPAMTTETRGQNSYVNFGPNGSKNQLASAADTQYAPQKIGLLPPEMSQPDDPEMHFLHMSNLDTPDATLDPKFYGRGMKGAEAKRGGTKTVSLYPSDIDPKDVEQPLQGKTPYRVSVPKSAMYDMSNDPEGLRANAPSYSDAEDAVKDAGYAGYHVPDGQGVLKGQGRLFGPTPASRLGPGRDPVVDEDLASGFADGGEVGPVVGGLADLIKQYAPEAKTIADTVAEHGSATYNPTSGDLLHSGYILPNHAARSAALDAAPDAGQIHDFLMNHQDAFDEDPSAVLHIHSDDDGNHFMHAAHYTPDSGDAADKTATLGLPGYQDIGTGEIGSPAPPVPEGAPAGTQSSEHNPQDAQDYLTQTAPRTSWAAGQQTVANPKRNAFPEIYGDPRTTIANATAKVGPEDPLMQRLFGVSRGDLSASSLSRQGNELGILPGAKTNPTGSAAATDVMTPQNAQRLVDVLAEAKKSPSLYQGMTGWYNMDPLYQRFVDIFGEDEAPVKYKQFNTLSGMASPGSDVGTEIARGSAANWLQTEGRFADFIKHGGGVESGPSGGRPADMADLPGHVYHRTAQAIPMESYLRTGQSQMKSPKVPMYIQASGTPETGFQTDTPVGDAHWARGVGLADTRGTRTSKGQEIVPGSSVSTPEMQQLAPWWRDKVAGQVGLESVPAQALAWGAFSPVTGVKSAIGAPKLEILSTQIGKLASRLGISPEAARDLVIQGKAGAFSDGGAV